MIKNNKLCISGSLKDLHKALEFAWSYYMRNYENGRVPFTKVPVYTYRAGGVFIKFIKYNKEKEFVKNTEYRSIDEFQDNHYTLDVLEMIVRHLLDERYISNRFENPDTIINGEGNIYEKGFLLYDFKRFIEDYNIEDDLFKEIDADIYICPYPLMS